LPAAVEVRVWLPARARRAVRALKIGSRTAHFAPGRGTIGWLSSSSPLLCASSGATVEALQNVMFE